MREERIIAVVDDWLATLTDADHLDATVEAVLRADQEAGAEPAEVAAARRDIARLETELDRMLAAIRAGMDPAIAANETRKIQSGIVAAEAVVRQWEGSSETAAPLSEEDVRRSLASADGLVGLLRTADRTERAALYRALGIRLTYEKIAPTGQERIHARLELCRGGGRI